MTVNTYIILIDHEYRSYASDLKINNVLFTKQLCPFLEKWDVKFECKCDSLSVNFFDFFVF